MTRSRKEALLGAALWVPVLCGYAASLVLPWFVLNAGTKSQFHNKTIFAQSQRQITGLDAFNFLFERLEGGCFVWFAHPLLHVGWLFLMFRRWRAASVAGCLALILALHTPQVLQPREGPWLAP